jgi:hypothetical protein
MNPRALLLAFLVPAGWSSGCDDTDSPPDLPPGVTITIATDTPAALVAFRDGLEAPWQAAAMKSPSMFEAEVHGPYVVTIVCQEPTGGLYATYQLAQTPDDERNLMRSCDYTIAPRFPVTGHMVQAGRVQIEDTPRTSSTPDWDFNLNALAGTRDLVALAADRIVLRRGLAIGGATAVTPPIDVAQDGTPLADVTFTATNAALAEGLVASVNLQKPFAQLAVFRGPIAAAKVAPDSVLIPTDTQSVSIQATLGASVRSLRRPFRVGGNTEFTLPLPLGDVRWAIAASSLTVSWSSAPPFDVFSVDASGSSDPTKFQNQFLLLSPRFMIATGITSATIDTDIPGFKPLWRIDFARPHYRRIFLQRVANDEISTSIVSEQINALTPVAAPAADRPLPGDRIAPP